MLLKQDYHRIEIFCSLLRPFVDCTLCNNVPEFLGSSIISLNYFCNSTLITPQLVIDLGESNRDIGPRQKSDKDLKPGFVPNTFKMT